MSSQVVLPVLERTVYNMEQMTGIPRTVTHDTQRPDIEYVWVDKVRVGEIRHKGQANEEVYLYD